MNKGILLVIFLGLSTRSHAVNDDCTPHLLAYMSGLEAASDPELERVKRLRAELPDCEVEQQIPALKMARESIDAAHSSVKKSN